MTYAEFKKHFGYYISLVAVLFLTLVLAVQGSYDRQTQIATLFFATLFYVIWGILHHVLHHDLHIKIVVEYVLIGILGIAVVLFVLQARLL